MSIVLVLSGCPAAGKSTFASWLAGHHGFHWIDVEHDVPKMPREFQRVWGETQAHPTPTNIAHWMQQLTWPRVIWDWSFAPGNWPVAEAIKAAGGVLWWFDAPFDVARAKFAERGRGSVEEFDQQMSQICQFTPQLTQVFAPNQLQTLLANGQHLEPTVIYQAMAHTLPSGTTAINNNEGSPIP